MKTFVKIFVSYMLKSELFRGLTDTVQTIPVSHMGNHILYIVDPNFELSVLTVGIRHIFPQCKIHKCFQA